MCDARGVIEGGGGHEAMVLGVMGGGGGTSFRLSLSGVFDLLIKHVGGRESLLTTHRKWKRNRKSSRCINAPPKAPNER